VEDISWSGREEIRLQGEGGDISGENLRAKEVAAKGINRTWRRGFGATKKKKKHLALGRHSQLSSKREGLWGGKSRSQVPHRKKKKRNARKVRGKKCSSIESRQKTPKKQTGGK